MQSIQDEEVVDTHFQEEEEEVVETFTKGRICAQRDGKQQVEAQEIFMWIWGSINRLLEKKIC